MAINTNVAEASIRERRLNAITGYSGSVRDLACRTSGGCWRLIGGWQRQHCVCTGKRFSFRQTEDASKRQKANCILNAKGCGDQALSIQTKIDRLKQEIEKGTKVYTPKELQKLKNKLEDANDVLDELLFHPTNN
ncbi:hypothetical protein F6V30_15235 [Oryzomonas sagensis]|uniref:Uncharacterized protein n=1 Tax=Oryzomonas sagensis TaxID=2603857 RepID=A0ABQ6TKM5_9BACT|nr:hypothetical protein [Oryzomonas sagensis]KAB0668691.1 hypothetical protein F6V30_15235 [Oryzomonas sagensis]